MRPLEFSWIIVLLRRAKSIIVSLSNVVMVYNGLLALLSFIFNVNIDTGSLTGSTCQMATCHVWYMRDPEGSAPERGLTAVHLLTAIHHM